MKPEALRAGEGRGRSLMNIDLVPREAARGRAGPGHPRCGLIMSGSTAQLRHHGETDWLWRAPEPKGPTDPAGACFLASGSEQAP